MASTGHRIIHLAGHRLAVCTFAAGLAIVAWASIAHSPYTSMDSSGSVPVHAFLGGVDQSHMRVPIANERRLRWIELPAAVVRGRSGSGRLVHSAEPSSAGAASATAEGKLLELSHRNALAAAATLAGQSGVTGSGVLVDSSAPGSSLHPADVIVRAAGKAIHTDADLDAVLAHYQGAGPLPVVLRTGEHVAARPRLSGLGDQARQRVGGPLTDRRFSLPIRAFTWHLELPTEVETRFPHRDPGVVGTSAGLATALAAYQELTGVDLERGRSVAATGFVLSSGRVLDVAGVREKVARASRDGVDIVLVPRLNLADAARGLPPDSKTAVVAVDSLDEAVDRLGWRT